MRTLFFTLIIVAFSFFILYGCGKKGPPTLKEIKAGVVYEKSDRTGN